METIPLDISVHTSDTFACSLRQLSSNIRTEQFQLEISRGETESPVMPIAHESQTVAE